MTKGEKSITLRFVNMGDTLTWDNKRKVKINSLHVKFVRNNEIIIEIKTPQK